MDKIKVYCPFCSKSFNVKKKYLGKDAKCKKCKKIFTIQSHTIQENDIDTNDEAPLKKESSTNDEAPLKKESSKKEDESIRNRVLVTKKKLLSKNFMVNLLGIAEYPLTGIAQFIIISIAQLLLDFTFGSGILGTVLSIFVYGFIMFYFFTIIVNSASGSPKAPDLIPDDKAEMAITALKALTIFFICFFAGFILKYSDMRELSVIAFLIGAFFFPLCLLSVALHDTIFALHPQIILSPLRRGLLPIYLLVFIIFYLLHFLGNWLLYKWGLGYVAKMFIFPFIKTYMSIVAMHILGTFYWCYQDKFGWFED